MATRWLSDLELLKVLVVAADETGHGGVGRVQVVGLVAAHGPRRRYLAVGVVGQGTRLAHRTRRDLQRRAQPVAVRSLHLPLAVLVAAEDRIFCFSPPAQ